MIWRVGEGERMRYGLNWARDAHTHLALMLFWRGLSHVYSVGFRLRKWHCGAMWLSRPLRRSCLYCDWARDVTCAQHWKGDPRW